MGMSAWGIIAAPFLAHAPAPEPSAAIDAAVIEDGSDIFSSFAPMDERAMSEASGGADTAVDIDDFGLNIADNDAIVDNVSVADSDTGEIANNMISDNAGITTVFNNTGNGVVFQNSVNVNIFLNEGLGN
ncbi:MAG: hypothetical protein ACX939_02875 [Hyphococcus sp.]